MLCINNFGENQKEKKANKYRARIPHEPDNTLSTFIYYYIRPAVTKMTDSDDWENQLDSDNEADAKKEEDKKKKFDDEDIVDAETLKKQKAEQAKKEQ